MLQAYQKPLAGDRIGVVFGTFAPMHQGHLEVILRAKKECDGVIVVCCGNNTDDKGCAVGLNLTKRYQYAREFFKDDDLVAVYAVHDPGENVYSLENWSPWMKTFETDVWSVAVKNKDAHTVWYVGEPIYAADLISLGYETVLLNRKLNPISATQIRQKPLKHWDKIVPTFRRHFSHNILIIGTASEGKTNLVNDLARYFGTSHAHEWPRDYMEKYCVLDPDLTALDFCEFLIGQYRHTMEQIDSPANRGIFFCDTDALVTNMYAAKYAYDKDCDMTPGHYLGLVSSLAEAIIHGTKWNHIFFLMPEASFEDDHARYMAHSDLECRRSMCQDLMLDASCYYTPDMITYLPGSDYKGNFDAVVKYVQEVIEHEESR